MSRRYKTLDERCDECDIQLVALPNSHIHNAHDRTVVACLGCLEIRRFAEGEERVVL